MRRRFCNARGRFVGWARLPGGLRSLWQVFRRRAFAVYPELPWVPFAVIPRLAAALHPKALVWEVGGGMSTLWLAHRAGRVVSIEASREWFNKLSGLLRQRGAKNVDLRYEWEAKKMACFEELPDGCLDLLLIDGGPREECLRAGFAKVRPGGHLYLDNWDVAAFWGGAEMFLETHGSRIASRTSFTDYVPGNLVVNEGLLLQLRN